MAEPAHRIRRLRWQVRTPSADAALGMRAMLREWMPDVEAALQQAFDAHGMGATVSHLDRLEVQLHWPDQATPQTLMQALGSALAHALQQAAPKMRPLPWDGQAVGEHAHNPIAALPVGERGALLCALLALKQHAPRSLQQALTMAWRDRQHGGAELTIDGRTWRVDEAALVNWQIWLAGGPEAGSLGAAACTPATGEAPGHAPMTATSPGVRAVASGHHAHPQSPGTPGSGPAQGGTPAAHVPHLQAQLMHYLRTGQMDWVLAGLPADQARQQLIEAAAHWVELGMWPDSWPVHAPLPDRLGAWCRWLSLLGEPQRLALIQREGSGLASSAPPDAHAMGVSLRALMQALRGSSADQLHALALWLDWQQAGGEAMRGTALQAWSQAALAWAMDWARQGPVHDAWRACRQQIAATLTPALAAGGGAPASHEALVSPDQGVNAPRKQASTKVQAQAADGATRYPSTEACPTPRAAATPGTDLLLPVATPTREPAISHGHVIAQAGLVLLHPYLARCFNALGLYPTGQRGPMADALWPRAASVLHCLAMGDGTEVLECDLGLIKPLLGRSEHEALSHGLPALMTHEREEAAALLQAVRGHWPALQGTSAEGLRQSFLQRPGWIEPLDRAWQLRVQPAAFDVLLGSLPWGLSMVKLPWMDRPMHVEWGTS